MSRNDTQAADQPNLLIKKASILAPVVAQMKNHKLLASYQTIWFGESKPTVFDQDWPTGS